MQDRIPSADDTESDSRPKLLAAERDVALAQAKFRAELHSASDAGRRLTSTVMKGAKPALIGVAVVTGVGLIVALWRSRRRPSSFRALTVAQPPKKSLWSELARAAVTALASSAGKHLAQKLAVERLNAGVHGVDGSGEGPRPPADS